LLAFFVTLSMIIIAFDLRTGDDGPLEGVRDLSQALVTPLQRGLTTMTRPVGDLLGSIADLASLRQDNRRLEAEADQLRTEIDQARDLAEENAELRATLELDESWVTQERVAAQVIADAPGNYRWAVVIDKGRAHGIKPDMAVINPDGLVGKIIQSDAHQATVLLLIDPNAGAAAKTGSGSAGLISGNGGDQGLTFEFVAKDEQVEPGTRVVTSNYNGGIFPPGIPIGLVSTVDGDVRAAEFDITVDASVDFGELSVLEVLLETGRALAENPS
jgi:rod shape-determining protein MreC